jgi:hypothetical protein
MSTLLRHLRAWLAPTHPDKVLALRKREMEQRLQREGKSRMEARRIVVEHFGAGH